MSEDGKKLKAPTRRDWEVFRERLAGDSERARDSIWHVACAIRDTAPSWWREVAAEMLERVAVGEDANRSLLVGRPNRRPKDLRAYRHRIFIMVSDLLEREGDRKSACEQVAKLENLKHPRVTKQSGAPKPANWRTIQDTYLGVLAEYVERVKQSADRLTVSIPLKLSKRELEQMQAKDTEHCQRYAQTVERVAEYDKSLRSETEK